MLNALKRHYHQQMMQPGFVGLFVNPFYFARKGLFDEVSTLSSHVTGRVLDVGCGHKPYEHLFRSTEYVGLEIDTPDNRARKRADVYYDGTTFPFESASFDSLVCNQVLEHVFEPDRFLREMARVLKPGGNLLLTVPFAWDEHEQPWDFARYSSFGLAAIMSKGGFEILEHRKTMADIRTLFQLLNAYLYKVTVTGSAYVNLVNTLVLMAPFNVMGSVLAWITPGNRDFYLDNVVLARKGTT